MQRQGISPWEKGRCSLSFFALAKENAGTRQKACYGFADKPFKWLPKKESFAFIGWQKQKMQKKSNF